MQARSFPPVYVPYWLLFHTFYLLHEKHNVTMVIHMTGLAILRPLPSDPAYNCRFCTVSDLISNEELNAHEASKHNVCTVCKKRYSSWGNLKTHCRQTKCAMVCKGCGHRGGLHHNNEYFEQHKQTHNVCDVCEKHFDTPSNLTHVSIVEIYSG